MVRVEREWTRLDWEGEGGENGKNGEGGWGDEFWSGTCFCAFLP